MIFASFTTNLLPVLANYAQVVSVVPIFAGVGLFYYKHTCHVKRCHRIAWHVAAAYLDHPVCKHHHAHANGKALG